MTHRHGKLTHAHQGNPGHRHGTMILGSRRPTKLGPPAVYEAPSEPTRTIAVGGRGAGRTALMRRMAAEARALGIDVLETGNP